MAGKDRGREPSQERRASSLPPSSPPLPCSHCHVRGVWQQPAACPSPFPRLSFIGGLRSCYEEEEISCLPEGREEKNELVKCKEHDRHGEVSPLPLASLFGRERPPQPSSVGVKPNRNRHIGVVV